MAATIEGAGVELAVCERGAGPDVLLVHDIAASAADLESLAVALSDRAHVIAYDRRGYGASGAPEPYEATTVHEQGEDAAAVLRALSRAPALLCGIGFGALVVLDLLTRHAALAGRAVLADPPLFAFVPEAAEVLSGERQALEEALREGGPALAVERWLGAGADPARLARARRAPVAFFADVAGLASWPVTRGGLRAIATPTTVLTGPQTPPHVAAAADALADLIPGADRRRDGDLAGAAGQPPRLWK